MNIALDISSTSIRVLWADGNKVRRWGSVSLAPGLVKDGLIQQPEAVGAAINGLFTSLKLSREKVIVTVTGLIYTYCIVSLPHMKPELLEDTIQRAARRELPLPLEQMHLSWQAIVHRPDDVDYFVLGVPQNQIDAMIETLAHAGIKPYIMDLKPLALARAANRENAIIAALEPECFDIVLLADGIMAVAHTVAPSLKKAAKGDYTEQMVDELSKAVKYYNSIHPEKPFDIAAPLLLTGELSNDAYAELLVNPPIEHPVERLLPPMEYPADLPVALYAATMGLALKKVTKKTVSGEDSGHFRDIDLNLLTRASVRITRPVLRAKVLYCVVLFIAIGLLFPVYSLKSEATVEIAHLQDDLSLAGQRLRQARLVVNQAIDKAKQLEATIAGIDTEVEALRQEYQSIRAARGQFSSDLQFAANALPDGARFTAIMVDKETIIVQGEVDDPFTVLSYATALEERAEFSEVRINEICELNSPDGEHSGVQFTVVATR